MSAEIKFGLPRKENQSNEIILGIPFKPFKNARKAYRPKGQEFNIPESYDHALGLRKRVDLLGIEGYIDVISENPIAPIEILVGGFSLTKPLGEADFRMTVRPGELEYNREPFILRFAFAPRTLSQYAKLLNSYADVKLGESEYLLAWNLSRPQVKKNIRAFETGEKPLIVQKNLFEAGSTATDLPISEEVYKKYEETDFDRISYVWLPDNLKPLRTIELTFHQYDHGDDYEYPTQPLTPEHSREPVLV